MRDPETGKTVTAPLTDEFIKSIAENQGRAYTVGKIGEDRFYDDNGDPIYPLNNGAIGKEEKSLYQTGTTASWFRQKRRWHSISV